MGAYTDGRLAICLGISPAWAWNLSARIFGEAGQTWDLWQVRLAEGDEVRILENWGPQITEVRVFTSIPKRRVIWVAERTIAA